MVGSQGGEMIRCPKCKSKNYYYDGAFILCRDCGFKEVARKIGGKLEDLAGKWRRNDTNR